jgi:hypothetical protein
MSKDRSHANDSFCGLDDDQYHILKEDIDRGIAEGNARYGYGGRKKIEVLSVEQILRKDSGYYGVKGMIVGISSVEHVVISTEFGCSNCTKKSKRSGKAKGVTFDLEHDPPLFSLPYHLSLNKSRSALHAMSYHLDLKATRKRRL